MEQVKGGGRKKKKKRRRRRRRKKKGRRRKRRRKEGRGSGNEYVKRGSRGMSEACDRSGEKKKVQKDQAQKHNGQTGLE